MGKVVWDGPLGGRGGAKINVEDINSIYTAGEREGRLDRDGLLDLIKTKGSRVDSVDVLNFLRLPRAAEVEED